jgi:hypothetical protein
VPAAAAGAGRTSYYMEPVHTARAAQSAAYDSSSKAANTAVITKVKTTTAVPAANGSRARQH